MIDRATASNRLVPAVGSLTSIFVACTIAYAIAISACATSSGSARSADDLVESGGDSDESRTPAARRRIEEWRQLHKAVRELSGGCGGVRPTLDAERTGVVIAATCIFTDDSATVPATARSLIAGLARLLARHPERDHWIGVYAEAGARDPWRLTTMRANALVAALAAEGVAAARLAAVGLGDVDERGDYKGPPHLAPGQALIEITVVAGDDELSRRLSGAP